LKSKSKFQKFIIIFSTLIVISLSVITYEFYTRIYQQNIDLITDSKEYIYVPSGSNLYDVVNILQNKNILINSNSFIWVAKQKKYDTNIKSGKYRINNKLNNNDLVNLLRAGNQVPVRITFNNIRTIEDFSFIISNQLEIDSHLIMKSILDSVFLDSLNLNKYSIASLFIPNTYEFYWNTSVENFVIKMINEHSIFWNKNRMRLAEKIGLSKVEVSILASIVEKEQNIKKDERKIIAGLYLNRIKKNMKLESDPTLVFALGDFSIKRVLNKDKKIKSKYNTYKYKGLPPGPICIPSINSIDAVLNAASHNYIFMCAKEDFSGYHNFANTYKQHLRNARKYQKALNKRNIMR
tara:strand:+ start:9721 stop:10773 length:1053 start_codon:yes stop_codon:yes gene_type:complete